MSSYRFEGVIIKRHNLGETDKLVTFFTKDLGKITLKARGLRKLSSKRAGALELFNLVRAQAVTGKGDLDTLTEVDLVEPFSSWRTHLGRVTLAYQLCEAIDKLTPDHQPHPEIFTLLVSDLSQISLLGEDWEKIMHEWLLDILRTLGFWPENQSFSGNINELLEKTTDRPLHSRKLLSKLK